MFRKTYLFFHRYYHKNYHGIYRHAKKLFVFDLALLALAVVMLGAGLFFFFWKPGITDLIDLQVSLGSERVLSGELVKVTVDYANRSKFKLTNSSLSLRLPAGFFIDRSRTPENVFSKNSIFIELKELPPGAKGQTEIYGRFWATPGKEEKIIADFSYEPEKMNRREQKISILYASLPGSILEGSLEISSSSFPNYSLPFKYELVNRGTETVSGISLASGWPEKFLSDKDAQNFTLPPGGVKVISGTVKMPDKSGKFDFDITPIIVIGNNSFPQSASRQTIQTISPQIISSAQIQTTAAYAEPGQTIPVQISWENKSTMPLQNMRVRISSGADGIVDWNKTAVENHARAEKNGLIIDGSVRTSLNNGAPGSRDNFTVNIILRPSFSIGTAEKAYLDIIPAVEAAVAGVSGQKFTQEGTRARLPLATEARLSAEARYYTEAGDQLGRGPLPPRVGKTTKYWIFFRVFNTTNGLDDASFSAVLPPGVELSGKQSVSIGPEITYDAASRRLSWNYNSLPANSQTGLYLEVAVTPTAPQIGQSIELLKNLKFTATDNFVGKVFNLGLASVKNILNKNDKGYASGSAVLP